MRSGAVSWHSRRCLSEAPGHAFIYMFESQATREEIRVPSNHHFSVSPFTPFRDLEQLEYFQREMQKRANPAVSALPSLYILFAFPLCSFHPQWLLSKTVSQIKWSHFSCHSFYQLPVCSIVFQSASSAYRASLSGA